MIYIRTEVHDNTTDFIGIKNKGKKIKIKEYYEQLYGNPFNNLDKMDTYTERHKTTKVHLKKRLNL